ncbi:hypothetical protein BU14_1265s0001 [Porphyra umbilicalis]|uniref:Hedgehog protein Hint domain-containing protein n=1 Tax=Porphyra umbilicalis TaxID=2786 RepID=A0A1X6NM27_PORUM|nr:hypothetical protein BU14_1265s0001 [Porphyra umbilicalis]|eukprot:OSX69691.1 hypothetical protein BU14_1265s0001 [Porphyra umbilicalis]
MARTGRALAVASVAAAAVAVTASATRAPPPSTGTLDGVASARAFTEKNVTGTYTFFKDFGVNGAYACPQSVVFNANPVVNRERSVFSVAHGSITQDGARCTGNSTLDVLPSSVLSKDDLMDGLGLTAMTELADTIVGSLFNNTRGFLLGVEPTGRSCGATRLPGGSAVLFVHEEGNVRLLDNLVLPGGGGVSYMGTIVPDKACLYVRGPGDRTPGVTAGGGAVNQQAGGGDADGAAPQSTPTPTANAATPTPAVESEDSCFPATAAVRLADGSVKMMADVAVGDALHVGHGAHSDVYAWSHKLVDRAAEFVAITTTAGEAASSPLLLSPSHYLYVGGALAAASSVRPGDALTDGAGAPLTVASVSVVTRTGVFAPHTLHGDLVVNGVRVSTYTRAVHPAVAHALLAPLRVAYRLGVKDPAGAWLYAGRPAGVVAALLPRGF